MKEATTEFESAISVASKHGYRFFEAMALRDLIKHVLAPSGSVVTGTRRLAAVLKHLTMTREEVIFHFGAEGERAGATLW
jgi:hypothetical protein